MAGHAGESARGLLIAIARHQPDRREADTGRVLQFRHLGSELRIRRSMTRRAQRHAPIPLHRLLLLRMIRPIAMTRLAMHSGPLPSHVTPKTSPLVLRALHNAERRVDRPRRLRRMSRRQAQPLRPGIVAHAMFDGSPVDLQHRRQRKMPRAEQPLNRHFAHVVAATNRNAFVRIRVLGAAAFAQCLAREERTVVRLQRCRMPRLRLLDMALRAVRRRYCCAGSENKSNCRERCFSVISFTRANTRAASVLRPAS